MKVDHFMYAVASMDQGIAWAESVFGVRPIAGGAHKGLGTRNALLAFDSSYLEIIAPDPAQSLAGTLGEKLAALNSGGLVTWAAASDLARTKSQLANEKVACAGPIETKRQQPDGENLVWQLLFPQSGLYGMPFFIDWMACTNPRFTSPKAGKVQQFTLHSPGANSLQRIFHTLGLKPAVSEGAANLNLIVDSPNGVVEITATDETRNLMIN